MHRTLQAVALGLALAAWPAAGADTVLPDIEYARVGALSLKLDLHRPEQPKTPLLVFVHGGGWREGSKQDMPLRALVQAGYAVASVNYRLSPEARFPAQVHDIKAAIRFLRAQQAQLGIAAERIVIVGASAGGHLAALVGMTNGHTELEGAVGEHGDQSSAVQGIISLFGASDLTTILAQSTEHGRSVRAPALQLLLGGQPAEVPALARLASPVFHVDAHDPPLLLIHGDADPQMPPDQSKELAAAYERARLPVQLVILPGAVHGGKQFYDAERTALMLEFLQKIAAK